MGTKLSRKRFQLSHPFLKMVYSRLHRQDMDFLLLIVGERGSGKSTAAVRLCELVDPNFTIDNVVFSPSEFAALLKSGTLKDGSAVLLDELGVAAGSRDWASVQNKSFNALSQVFRTRHLFVVFTAPSEKMVDSQVLKNLAAVATVAAKFTSRQLTWLKILRIQPASLTDVVYHKYYRFFNPQSGELKRYSRLGLHTPSPPLLRAYKKKRKAFASVVLDDMQLSVETGKYHKYGRSVKPLKAEKKVMDFDAICNEVASKPAQYRTGMNGAFDALRISKDFEIAVHLADKCARRARTIANPRKCETNVVAV